MAFMDDNGSSAVKRDMTILAAETAVDGNKELRLDRKTAAFIQRLPEKIAEAERNISTDGLRLLAESIRVIQTCAIRARIDKYRHLPACGKYPRVSLIAQRLISDGDRAVDAEHIQCALYKFDELCGLKMDEFWAFREAVRIEVCERYATVARQVLAAAAEHQCAGEWINKARTDELAKKRSTAFYERALQLAMDAEMPEARLKIENMLFRMDMTPDMCICAAQESAALANVRIRNLTAAARAVEAANWLEIFENASSTEACLRRDPDGVYPCMHESSRAAVRNRLAMLARHFDVGENMAARFAVNAAGRMPAGDLRRGICWWLYDDDGNRELARIMGVKCKWPKLYPDPGGYKYMTAQILISFALSIYLAALCGSFLCAVPLLPVVWHFAQMAIANIVTKALSPRPVLRIEYEFLPDGARTLVAVPALLTSPARAVEMCRRLETHGCLEKDKNIEFVLLGDFADSPHENMEGDAAIMNAANAEICRLNAEAGRQKYHYLQRKRSFAAADGIFRGKERKRGALMALCRVVTGRSRGEFDTAGTEDVLFGRFRYIVTLDSDTDMLPGTVAQLVGAISHPLNRIRYTGSKRRGFSVMQPMVELAADECGSRFVRIFAGAGGLNTYSGLVSDLFHDLSGVGAYCGKGVIDAPMFLDCLEGKLAEDRILSHDLIEGLLSGAGHINDVSVFDGYPEDYNKWITRLSRWTRGDWQLLPEFLRDDIPPLGKFRMASNLIESLREPALLLLFILAVWVGNAEAFALGILFAIALPCIMYLLGDRQAFIRGSFELAALPATAYARCDAVCRALWRTFVSGRKLLDWVTSADAKGNEKLLKTATRAAAILLIPGLFSSYWFAPSVALGTMFLIADGFSRDISALDARKTSPDADEERELRELARDTWRFFERYVTEETNHLPPDNVQTEPDNGIARRTSPTNIAMYLLSCLCACRLGFIGKEEMLRRMEATLSTLDKMEKWKGHIYNWYSTDTLDILAPGYISAVDSGNLAAALLLCGKACGDEALSRRFERMAGEMELSALYDENRKLFRIGMDAEHGRLSQAHYDLLASEARILSFTAIMLGQVPVEHWRYLGRPVSGDVLMSWSGTMFEYFMPALIMPSASGSLLGRTYSGVIRSQMAYAKGRGRPWGISESGYYAFDSDMNYQYRAFGLRNLSMSGNMAQDVVAPYGACLALCIMPDEAQRNISQIVQSGWCGECGLYEAVDFVRREPRIVKSWMAHHQGMALCAMCNRLADNYLAECFMEIPQARALKLLLNERAVYRTKLQRKPDPEICYTENRHGKRRRRANADTNLADTALIGGNGASALIYASGAITYSANGIYASRYTGDTLRRSDGTFTYVVDETSEAHRLNTSGVGCVFGEGTAVFTDRYHGLEISMTSAVSPEDGALVKYFRVKNNEDRPRKLSFIDGFEVALMDIGELRSHPAFHRLFVRSDLSCPNAVISLRRSREAKSEDRAVVHAAAGNVSGRETDWMRLMGRNGSLRTELDGRDGMQTDPCSALRVDMDIPGGGISSVAFAVALCSVDDAHKLAVRYSDLSNAERACGLSEAFARSVADFAGLNNEKCVIAERACALLADPRLAISEKNVEADGAPAAAGYSELPCMAVDIDSEKGLDVLRDAVRMHEYCHMLGFGYRLVLMYKHADYEQPLRDGIREIIGASHLRDMNYGTGGVVIYDALVDERRCNGAVQGACILIDSRSNYWEQLRRKLACLKCDCAAEYEAIPRSVDNDQTREGMKYGEIGTDGYDMQVSGKCVRPAPWSNIIMGDRIGMLITERGGGFIWHGNSRLRRITAFDNDPAHEGWGCMLYVSDDSGRYMRALPGDAPDGEYAVTHGLWGSRFSCAGTDIAIDTEVFGDERDDVLIFSVRLENRSDFKRQYRVTCFVDWLMGVDGGEAAYTRSWNQKGTLLAYGAMEGTAFLASTAKRVVSGPDRNAFLGKGTVMHPDGLMKTGSGGSALTAVLDIAPGCSGETAFVLGCRDTAGEALKYADCLNHRDVNKKRADARAYWDEIKDRFEVDTGDRKLDWLMNGFLVKQVMYGRIKGRTGFYQAGGAYGFRDQLQDMLAVIPYEPDRVRRHILLCAGRQFQDGDVMHWWHPPMTGVRTRISDDMLFLPFVTAHYVKHTGDAGIMAEEVSFLKNTEIPEGREDVYSEMQVSSESGTIAEHCMRAFRRACRRGAHGLLLMGSGDWNDGMNRVGSCSRGESVWLTMFFAVCARLFAEMPGEGIDRNWLVTTADELMTNVQSNGWDGKWYLRAYNDDGAALGSSDCEECRIDLIAQSWAAFSECPPGRVDEALDAAWKYLYMPDEMMVKLLTPPFEGRESDPGYIAAYPPGVRENGGQYTHAACWYLIALAKNRDADRVKELLHALMPLDHAQNDEQADIYRVEPYVMAADVYGEVPYTGRGGWTWYTGAAGWFICAVRYIMGYERRGNRVRLNALSGVWARPKVRVRYGKSVYTLISDDGAVCVTADGKEVSGDFVEMTDDGSVHICIFPTRSSRE